MADSLGNWLRAAVHECEYRAIQAPLQCSLLSVLALLAISIVALRISYDTNDDVFMTMIVAGQGFCAAPDEHLIFTNVIIGQALKQLYMAWPQVPWYGCYLLFVHFLAQAALLYCALATELEFVPARNSDATVTDHSPRSAAEKRRFFRLRFALYLLYFAVVELALLNNLQFTTTAFLAAQAGLFLLWLAARRRARQLVAAWPLCAAVLLLVAAGLIRLESLSMALLVAAPLGMLLVRQVSRWAILPIAAAAAFALILIVLATAYNRAAYERDPQWSRFYAYNQLRCRFNDYRWTSYTPQTARVFSAVGWTKNDHDMIANWFFDDPALYSEANLRSVLEAHPWKTARLTPEYFRQVSRGPLQDRSVWAAMLVLPFFLMCIGGSKHARRAVLGCAIMAVALVVFLIVNNKLPPMRTYFPLLSFPLSVAFLFPASASRANSLRTKPGEKVMGLSRMLSTWKLQRPMPRAVVVLLVIGTAMGVYRQCRRSVRVQRERSALQTFLADVRPEGRDLYVCWEAAMPFELVSPLDSLRSWSRVSLINLTWTQRTPWQEEVKRRFGISCLAQAMCERDDIVLIARTRHRSLFVTFAKEHFSKDVEFVQSKSFDQKFVVGRFQQRSQLGQTAGKRSTAAQHR